MHVGLFTKIKNTRKLFFAIFFKSLSIFSWDFRIFWPDCLANFFFLILGTWGFIIDTGFMYGDFARILISAFFYELFYAV